MTRPPLTAEQAFRIAGALQSGLALGDQDVDTLVEHLRGYAATLLNQPARWAYYGGYTDILYAADPGCPVLPSFRRVPAFALHVQNLLAMPGHPLDVSPLFGPAKRSTAHAERSRLADRLADRKQVILATAIADDIHLEQDGNRVLAIYDPIGIPLTFEDYP